MIFYFTINIRAINALRYKEQVNFPRMIKARASGSKFFSLFYEKKAGRRDTAFRGILVWSYLRYFAPYKAQVKLYGHFLNQPIFI